MDKQDLNGVRSPQDLERKYDFAAFLKLKKNIEMHENVLLKVENELNNMLNALIINLKDVLDEQEEISLYYAEGKPELDGFPSNSWEDKTKHYGDLYYDQLTGYVYQFLKETNNWEIKNDANLVQAMALTNIEIDTTIDKERKIYFSQPIPPYSSGDWWVKEDGVLYICQLGKDADEVYEENDFIISSKYTATVAIKENETIKVLKGTVTEFSEKYVKYTDLSTGGSTTIAGENITTGNIKSANYLPEKSGMKIDLENGTINSANSKLDELGNWVLKNGATVISDKGLKTTYLSSQLGFVGFGYMYVDEPIKWNLIFDFIIPANFNITKAFIKLIHAPVYWHDSTWGRSKNIKLYKANNIVSRRITASYLSEYTETDTTEYIEIENAFGSSGFTAQDASESNHNNEEINSIDIKKDITSGINRLKIETSDESSSNKNENASNTGYIYALLEIDGNMEYEI